MKYPIILLTLAVSSTVLAEDKPVSKSYKCQNNGCSLSCLSDRERWSTLANGAIRVEVNKYANGNVEFLLKHDPNNATTPNSDEIIFISQENLQCKLSGVVIET